MSDTRLIIGDHWGEPMPPHVSFNVLADEVYKAALKRGGIAGLKRYPFKNGDGEDGKLPPAALGLDYKPTFPESWNVLSNIGSPPTVALTKNLFRDNTDGFVHVDGTPNPPAPYVYTAAHLIAKNQPHTLRSSFAKLPDADEGQPKQIGLYRYPFGRFRFEIRDSQARITYLSKDYTTTLDSELDALIKLDERTSLQESRAGEIRAKIFEVDQDVKLASGAEFYDFHSASTLTFLAEPRGVLRIECLETKDFEVIEIPSLLKKRSLTDSIPNEMWSSFHPTVTSYGGVFAWQFGRPQFDVIGTMKLGRYAAGFGVGTIPTKGQWDVSLPGTNITFENVHIEADTTPPLYSGAGGTSPSVDEFVATLTSDGTYTPFLYAANCFKQAGIRNGTDANIWDSDAHIHDGTNPILDVTPQFEREGRRANWTVILRNVTQADGTNQLGNWPDAHDRMSELMLGNAPSLRKGYIKNVVYNDMASVATSTRNAFEKMIGVPSSEATITLELSDAWFIVDDDLMEDDPIGDGLYLADYLRTVLFDAGFDTAELAGIPSSEFEISARLGHILPTAALGETFAVRPTPDTYRGDYLRDLIDKYGMGMKLWWDNTLGRWTFAHPSTIIRAAFSGSKDTPIPYRMEQPIDRVDDFSDTYNVITVQGADDENGVPITRTWTIWEGFRAKNNYVHIGRKRKMPVVKDDALRTVDDVMGALRTLVEKHSRAGRFVQFTTWFIPNLFPGDYVTVDGITGIVERIESGSLLGGQKIIDGVKWFGRMALVVRLLQKGEKP